MVTIITSIANYLLIILGTIYTLSCFTVFKPSNQNRKEQILNRQIIYMLLFHFLCYLILLLRTENFKTIMFYGVQTCFIGIYLFLYHKAYKDASRLISNNMCFLLVISFIMLTRLSFDLAIKQFAIVVACTAICSVIPWILKKLKALSAFGILYGIAGLLLLGSVFVFGVTKYGATNWISVAGISLQPSEFVKILFVFFVASMLAYSNSFRQVVITTVIAGIHVLVLVLEKDLGAALIFFMVYLIMLFAATGNYFYFFGGMVGGSLAAFLAYKLFPHVQVRVVAWQNPWPLIDNKGYQITQSLFAIGTGGWFGMGLAQGMPNSVPVVETDFIFSAIVEELGGILGFCVILICVSCFVLFLDVAMRSKKMFPKLLSLGFGAVYIFQVFLSIGGVTKFIPSTGVTLPLVSYGGSSVLSTLIIFQVIQGLYIAVEQAKALESQQMEVTNEG